MSRTLYTREEHIAYLKKIRDASFRDEDYKLALQAETTLGKAAGLYENLADAAGEAGAARLPDPTSLSTEELRAQLARALPAPGGAVHRMPPEDLSKALDNLPESAEDEDERPF